MKKENEELLIKDLSGRLSCGVIVQLRLYDKKTVTDARLTGIYDDGDLTVDVLADCIFNIKDVKPYLRPLSSITEEEKKQLDAILVFNHDKLTTIAATPQAFDWLNEHHFDFRNLIPKKLAIAVTEDNNPYK